MAGTLPIDEFEGGETLLTHLNIVNSDTRHTVEEGAEGADAGAVFDDKSPSAAEARITSWDSAGEAGRLALTAPNNRRGR